MTRPALDLLAASDPDVERIWRSLEAYAQPSYFLSWGWVSTWLAALPANQRPSLAVLHDGREVSGAFFLARRRVRRNLLLQSNALFFNATGSARHDEIGLAHNGMLAVPGAQRSLAHVLAMLPSDWDELHLPAVDRDAFDDLGAASPLATRYRVRMVREETAPYVDLDAVRARGYAALLASGPRSRLERTCGIFGPTELEVAGDARQALDIYDELLRLHARNQAARNERSAFADPWVEGFHRHLVRDRLAHGEIQLLRVRRGGATLGCLYNFVHRGRVVSFQAGFADDAAPCLDLAALTHAASVAHNADAGHARYDLRDESLATGSNRMIWLTVQRPLAWVSFEDTARRWVDAIVGDRSLAAA